MIEVAQLCKRKAGGAGEPETWRGLATGCADTVVLPSRHARHRRTCMLDTDAHNCDAHACMPCVEARDVASPNFPLEGNYMTATPQGIGELGANLVRILKQCVGNFC